MDLGLRFGSPGGSFSGLVDDFFSVFSGCGPEPAFGWILDGFGRHFGDILVTFGDFL